MKYKILLLLLLTSVSIYLVFQHVYQDHKNIAYQDAKHRITSDLLLYHYSEKPDLANDLYLNQILELKGVVKSVADDLIILHPGVVCKLDNDFHPNNIKSMDSVVIKARCIGFDDLFGEVKMDKTIINRQ